MSRPMPRYPNFSDFNRARQCHVALAADTEWVGCTYLFSPSFFISLLSPVPLGDD